MCGIWAVSSGHSESSFWAAVIVVLRNLLQGNPTPKVWFELNKYCIVYHKNKSSFDKWMLHLIANYYILYPQLWMLQRL